MSLILKGIDLPKDGEWLSVIIKPTKEVIVDTIRYGDYALLKTEYGLAIQIPTPHGRLIDGDKLRDTLQRWTEDEWNQKASPVSWAYAYEDIIDLIDDAPTILEAEQSVEMEEWNSYSHGKIYAPKGTFQKILESEE